VVSFLAPLNSDLGHRIELFHFIRYYDSPLLNDSLFSFQSGSKIHISDGSSSDRIVTVTGTLSAIYKAFTLITAKVQEVRAPVMVL
jgi:hypothetical protein